ncbi:MAG: vitamin K epoxide reductase family protein [Pyrinomonadaceae bacterium]|nr:vitamin K epoxide reductase family protein [Pyrinomonadaceae bacterium]
MSSETGGAIAKLPLLAAVVALFGLADAIYLTIYHYTAVAVPCGETFDCGAVLNSQYAEIAGVPLAIFGAAAYFAAFALAILTAFGNRATWRLFGGQVTLMLLFTAWLVYLQAFVIEAFCQFCLLSAATTLVLFTIFLISKFSRLR